MGPAVASQPPPRPLFRILSQISPVHAFSSHFFEFNFNTFLPSTLQSAKCSLSWSLPRTHLFFPIRATCSAHHGNSNHTTVCTQKIITTSRKLKFKKRRSIVAYTKPSTHSGMCNVCKAKQRPWWRNKQLSAISVLCRSCPKSVTSQTILRSVSTINSAVE